MHDCAETPFLATVDHPPALHGQLGFLLRRGHQIAVSIFLEQTAAVGVTETQYALMSLLQGRPGLDQATLARLAGLDRSTTGLVLGKLESLGLVVRAPAMDRRRKALSLTPAGHAMARTLDEAWDRVQARAAGPFSAAEQDQLLALLGRFAAAHNSVARAPLSSP